MSHLRTTGANDQLATRIAAWHLARRLGHRRVGKGAALGRDRGDARPHALAIAPLNAPRTQRWGRWVWCVPMGVLARRPNVMPGMQTGGAPGRPRYGAGRRGSRGSEVAAAVGGAGMQGRIQES